MAEKKPVDKVSLLEKKVEKLEKYIKTQIELKAKGLDSFTSYEE
jgi:hypothetical protein